jgi:hypothetical protein
MEANTLIAAQNKQTNIALLQRLETMLTWIRESMIWERWYDVKTDDAFFAIETLMTEGLIPECEFDSKQLKFRKVDLDFSEKTAKKPNIYTQ